jgi:hypothetical protein
MNNVFKFLTGLLVCAILIILTDSNYKTIAINKYKNTQDSLKNALVDKTLASEDAMGYTVVEKRLEPKCITLQYDTIKIGGGFCASPPKDSVIVNKIVHEARYILVIRSNFTKKKRGKLVVDKLNFDKNHVGEIYSNLYPTYSSYYDLSKLSKEQLIDRVRRVERNLGGFIARYEYLQELVK